MKFLNLLALFLIFSVNYGWGQTTQTWTGTTNTTWLTATNWNSAVPGSKTTTTNNDIAYFNNITQVNVGINMNTQGGAHYLGAINFGSSASSARTVNNSSSTVAGTLYFNGVTLNSLANTIIWNQSSALHTLTNGSNLLNIGLNSTDHVIQITGSGGITIASAITGTSKNLEKAGTGTGVLILSGANTYTGKTTISAGTLRLGVANAIPVAATGGGVTLNGGILSTGTTTGYNEGATGSTNMGVLILSANSTIALGTGIHSLFFANSSAETWIGSTLTITGWTGTAGSSGTAGKIYVGSNSSGLTSAQLAKISFTGYTAGAQILSTGEIVPPSTPTVSSSAATSISANDAILNGNVISDGGATLSEKGFVYKTSAGVLITDNKTIVSGTSTGAYTLTPTLSVNTHYYFKAYAINSIGTTLSTEQNFWTLANVPSAPTVSNATPNTLDVAVNVNNNPASTEFSIQETTTGNYVQANGTLGATAVWQTAATWGTKTITGLSTGTNYIFQIKARNGANTETAYGSTASLSTASVSSPTIFTSGTLSAVNSTYGTASATPTSFNVSGSAMEEGVLVTPPAGFEVSLISGSGYANTVTVGSAGTITSTPVYVRLKATATVAGSPYTGNIVLSSLNASSVNIATTASTVAASPLTITGLTGTNKVYDGNATAAFTGTPTYSGLFNGENFTVTGTPSASFANSNAGNGKVITIFGYESPSTNYTLTQPSLSANITTAPLTITGINIADKTYNGNTTATITGTATYSGLVNGETFTVTGTPSAVFADANVNSSISVTVSGYTAPSANYSVTQPTGITGNIVKANQTITLASTAINYIGVADYSPATSPTSGVNAITYTSSNTNVASIVAGKIHIVALGETTITASQAGNTNYNAAADVTQTLTVQTNTDYFRSKATGNWNVIGTWESSANGTSGWANATITPGATNSVYIQSGHTVTLTQNEYCKDLNIANSTTSSLGTRGIIALGNFTLNFYGKLRSYYGAVGVIPGTNASNGFSAYPFTSSGGKLSAVGDTRNLTNTGEWGATLSTGSANFPLEINLNSGQTVTAVANMKCSSLNVVSGTFEFTTLGLDNGTTGQGNATIGVNATIISSATSVNAFQKTGTTLAGVLTVNGTLKFTGASPQISMTTIDFSNGTVEYSNSSLQTLAVLANSGANPNTYNNLKINNTAGVSLSQNVTVNGTLDLTSGKIATGANTLTLGADGSVINASSTSYVNGNLVKLIKAGTDPVKTFEIGDATTYAPVSVAITGTVTNSTGSIQAVTTSGDHANISTSGLYKTVNRKWTLSSPVAITGLTSYSPTFNFVSGDIDAGATTSNFIVKRYASSAWTTPTTGTQTSTSTQATGLTAFGDFVVGEVIGTPTATSATNISSTTFRANVNAVTDATGYVIDVASDLAFNNIVSFYNGMSMSGTYHNITGLTPNTTYYYRVRATTTNSTSANSNVITVTTLASYSIGLSAASNGTITSGAGNYDAGSTVTIVATPNAGYHFVNWTDNGSEVSTLASYTFTASTTRNLVANFASNTVALNSSTTNASALVNCDNCDVTVGNGAELAVNANKTFNSVTVAAGGKLTLADGNTLTSPVTLQSSSTATGTFVDSRTDVSPTAITGTVQQYLPQGRNWYVGIPVTTDNETSLTAAGAASVSYWNEAGSAWVNNYTGTLTKGVGYIAVSQSGTNTSNISFSGTLNSGPVTVTLSRAGSSNIGYNLIANPYPSYLDAMSVINANANMQKTIWYRTKGASYVFETVNTTSGVGTNASGNGAVTGIIPPMQAFWVRTLTHNNPLTFTNAMRYHANPTIDLTPVTTTPLKAPKAESVTNKLLRLQVAKGTATDETVLYFNPNATTGYDAYDSQKWSNANVNVPELYTIATGETLAINGLPQVVYNQELPLGFYTGSQSTFSIKATEMSNFDANTRIVIIDKNNSAEYDLTGGQPYEFSSSAFNSINRFSIIFRTVDQTTGIDESELSNSTIIYANNNREIIVKTNAVLKPNASLAIYNAVGQQINNQKAATNMSITNVARTAGVYWVKLTNDGETVVRKLVIN